VVVCTRNRADQLSTCLDALGCQTNLEFETLVVDNAPVDQSTRDLIYGRYKDCRYIVEPRQGIACARNRGIAESRGEIVAFVDDDCRPIAGWLDAIAANFLARPWLACCTGPVLPMEVKTPAQRLMEVRGGFNKGFVKKVFGREPVADQSKSYPLQTWMCGTGGNMSFRRSVFNRIGLFDEWLQSAEDLEMFYRVLRHDLELIYEPVAVVQHQHVDDYWVLRRRLYRWGLGYIAYLAKVARHDPIYRKKALCEIIGWYSYQVKDRLWPRLRGERDMSLPLDLILAEIAGGLVAIPCYLLQWLRALCLAA
jgi:glycosyltransferase involved in cell wall biosynthesis